MLPRLENGDIFSAKSHVILSFCTILGAQDCISKPPTSLFYQRAIQNSIQLIAEAKSPATMDMRKYCQQYRLKGATKILSEHSVDELSKTPQETDLEPICSSTIPHDHPDSITSAYNLPQAVATTTSMLYINTSDAQTSGSTATGSNSNPSFSIQSGTIMQSGQQDSARTAQFLPCDIKSLFECPICFDFAVPPIYQCQNGHLVCQSCSSKITHCPTCRVPISGPSIRNLQLDRLANTFQFPCKFNFNGCPWKSYWFQKREHEEHCDYISYSCPCPGTACKWTGLLSQVMPHLSENHKSITTLNGDDIVFLATDINLKGAVDWVMIQSCFNHHFLLVLEKQELKTGQQQFFAMVQLIGSQKEAKKFKYRLELSDNSSGQVRRLQWEATPRSILDGIQIAISTHDCLVFDARMAQHFLSPIQQEKDDTHVTSGSENQGENLGINVTIDCLI